MTRPSPRQLAALRPLLRLYNNGVEKARAEYDAYPITSSYRTMPDCDVPGCTRASGPSGLCRRHKTQGRRWRKK